MTTNDIVGLRARDVKVSRSRNTLGIEPAIHGERCVCGTTDEVNRINIDGIWNYLCNDCFQTLHMLFLGEDISARLEK